MNAASITKAAVTDLDRDMTRFRARTEADVHAAALANPDAQPWTEEQPAKARRVPTNRIASAVR